MRILYLHQYFKTPAEPGSTRSYWISKALLEAGHEVVMITQNKEATVAVERKRADGIEVIQIRNRYSNEMTIPQRLWSYGSFMVKATFHALRQKQVDLVIATSTPLSIGFPAVMMKWCRRVPFVFEVRDLWPEVPIQMGGMPNALIRRIARWFEATIYRNALHVVALSPGMRDGVTRHIDSSRVSMIPNMAKNDKFWPRPKNERLLSSLGLSKDSFKVIHFGSMGIANGLMYILRAAYTLAKRGETGIEFVFLGEGGTKRKCVEFATSNKLSNTHFFERVPMDQTSEIVNLCDASVVPFVNLPVLATNSPNKLFDSLSAAKPVIVNSNGWTRDIVEANGCGAYVEPEKPEELVNLLIKWRANPALVNEMGQNARRLAVTMYDKSLLTREFVDMVARCEREFVVGKRTLARKSA